MKHRKLSPFIYSLTTLVILLALVLVARSFVPDRVQITILSTTDLHGNLNPIDYYTNKPDNRGLAKIATLIKRIRKEQPNVLLIDSGDTIQGDPVQALALAPRDGRVFLLDLAGVVVELVRVLRLDAIGLLHVVERDLHSVR